MPEGLRKFSPVMFLTLVVFIAVSLLVLTESFTGPVVERRLQQQVVDKMTGMFPDVIDWDEEDGLYTLYADEQMTEFLGYAFLATGSGYGGDINILVGLEDARTVKGVVILSHSETPGIGTRAMEPAFLDQFIGLNIDDIDFVNNGGQIDAVTGATISSSAIVNAIKETAMEKVAQLEGME